MLPVSLVSAYVRRGRVYPRYIDLKDPELLATAEALVARFQESVGRTRGELTDQLRELVADSPAFLLHRGLVHLLLGRCRFETAACADPAEWRQEVFLTAARQRRQTGGGPARFRRDALLHRLAAERGLAPEQAEAALYADLKDAQIVQGFEPIGPAALLQRYNTALAQAVLLRATHLLIHLEPQPAVRYRQIFRFIKFFQLLYRLQGEASGGFRITLDGPLSLFQSSQRYGLRLAQFLPALLLTGGWRLEAEILWGRSREPRQFLLTADRGLRSHYADTGIWIPEEVLAFADRFGSLESPWRIEVAADLLDLGGALCIPDFVFTHRDNGQRLYLELFGFWRRSGVEERLAQIRAHGRRDILIAVGKRGRVSEEELAAAEGQPLYYFRGVMSPKEVLQRLDERRVE